MPDKIPFGASPEKVRKMLSERFNPTKKSDVVSVAEMWSKTTERDIREELEKFLFCTSALKIQREVDGDSTLSERDAFDTASEQWVARCLDTALETWNYTAPSDTAVHLIWNIDRASRLFFSPVCMRVILFSNQLADEFISRLKTDGDARGLFTLVLTAGTLLNSTSFKRTVLAISECDTDGVFLPYLLGDVWDLMEQQFDDEYLAGLADKIAALDETGKGPLYFLGGGERKSAGQPLSHKLRKMTERMADLLFLEKTRQMDVRQITSCFLSDSITEEEKRIAAEKFMDGLEKGTVLLRKIETSSKDEEGIFGVDLGNLVGWARPFLDESRREILLRHILGILNLPSPEKPGNGSPADESLKTEACHFLNSVDDSVWVDGWRMMESCIKDAANPHFDDADNAKNAFYHRSLCLAGRMNSETMSREHLEMLDEISKDGWHRRIDFVIDGVFRSAGKIDMGNVMRNLIAGGFDDEDIAPGLEQGGEDVIKKLLDSLAEFLRDNPDRESLELAAAFIGNVCPSVLENPPRNLVQAAEELGSIIAGAMSEGTGGVSDGMIL